MKGSVQPPPLPCATEPRAASHALPTATRGPPPRPPPVRLPAAAANNRALTGRAHRPTEDHHPLPCATEPRAASHALPTATRGPPPRPPPVRLPAAAANNRALTGRAHRPTEDHHPPSTARQRLARPYQPPSHGGRPLERRRCQPQPAYGRPSPSIHASPALGSTMSTATARSADA